MALCPPHKRKERIFEASVYERNIAKISQFFFPYRILPGSQDDDAVLGLIINGRSLGALILGGSCLLAGLVILCFPEGPLK